MIKHYCKIAGRNLWKYKQQSIISIMGLAVGFVCFAMSTVWIRYELSFDTFHRDADRIFRIRQEDKNDESGFMPVTPYPLAAYLKNTFPEVEDACPVRAWPTEIQISGKKYPSFSIRQDSAFLQMFDIRLVEGNMDFTAENSDAVAVTEAFAKRIWGNDNPLGKEIREYGSTKTVQAVVTGWSQHSNMPFDILAPIHIRPDMLWRGCMYQTYIRVKKGTDIQAFEKKLYAHTVPHNQGVYKQFRMTPLTALHYTGPDKESNVKFNHILLFAVAGVLVIFCALFNYLTLFVTRLRMREKELALRKINGASGTGLLLMLSTELVLTLCCSIAIGILIMEWWLPAFKTLAGIYMNDRGIYLETMVYALFMIGVLIMVSLLPIHYFRRQTLQNLLKGENGSEKKRNLFRKASLTFQLIISIGFIFCASVLFKQIYHLRHTDMGIERNGIGSILGFTGQEVATIAAELQQLPVLQDVITAESGLLPQQSRMFYTVEKWEDMPANAQAVSCNAIDCDSSFFDFYKLKLIKGNFLSPAAVSKNEYIINEAAAKAFGWHDPVGKKMQLFRGRVEATVIGMVRNFYTESPTMPVQPMIFTNEGRTRSAVLFKYAPKQKDKARSEIASILKKIYPQRTYSFYDSNETAQKYIQSETYLLFLLGTVSGVCILISIFGIYSLASLTCQQRKKEIAIRKVLGANLGSIVRLFYKEYLLLLSIGALVAFTTGYSIMKPWTQQYIQQTTIPPGLFVAIFVLIALCTLLTVLRLVWQAASGNLANVIKNE